MSGIPTPGPSSNPSKQSKNKSRRQIKKHQEAIKSITKIMEQKLKYQIDIFVDVVMKALVRDLETYPRDDIKNLATIIKKEPQQRSEDEQEQLNFMYQPCTEFLATLNMLNKYAEDQGYLDAFAKMYIRPKENIPEDSSEEEEEKEPELKEDYSTMYIRALTAACARK